MPLAITAETASPAARMDEKSASNVRTARGTGSRRTVMRVATPKLPSEPTNRPVRSGPHGSPPGLPSCTTWPFASTTSSASTWVAVTPYLRQWGPPAFSATLPPMVHADWLEGSGAYSRPYGAAAAESLAFTTPGSTTATRLWGSSLRIRLRRVSTRSTAPASASAPPDRPVPAPRGTNGTSCAASRRTRATTSSRVPGSTTTSGTRRWTVKPSFAYVTRSAAAMRTCGAPTSRVRASTSARSITRRARSRDGHPHGRSAWPARAPRRAVRRRRRAA